MVHGVPHEVEQSIRQLILAGRIFRFLKPEIITSVIFDIT